MSYPVKFFTSNMRGAPVITGAADGSLLSVLRACLVTGFGSVTARSVSVENGIATAELNAADGFDPYVVIQIEGSMDPQLNGLARVLSSSSTAITWATDAASGPASGVINIRYAPAGWAMPYDDGNIGVFHSLSPLSPQHCLRVDDTNRIARVRGYESMSSRDDGVGPFPSPSYMSGGGVWPRSAAANGQAISWVVVADSQFFLIGMGHYASAFPSSTGMPLRGFGDLLTPTDDAWSTVLAAGVDGYGHQVGNWGSFVAAHGPALFSPRDRGGTVYSPRQCAWPLAVSNGYSGADNVFGPLLNADCIFMCRRFVSILANEAMGFRGYVPGLFHMSHSGAVAALQRWQMLPGEGDLLDRRLLAVPSAVSSNVPSSVDFIDITGPWR